MLWRCLCRMQVSLEQLRTILKSTNIPVYREYAPESQDYPYIIYEFVNETYSRASDKVLVESPLYQISYITKGIEKELSVVKQTLNQAGIVYESFSSGRFDENDETITQFNTFVRCVHDG